MKNSKNLRLVLVAFLVLISIVFIMYNNNSMKENRKNNKNREDNGVVIKGEASYNVKLIKEVNKKNKDNYLISPYSIKVALHMLEEGANNGTKEEILNLVGNENNKIPTVKGRVNVANALFIKKAFERAVSKDYSKELKQDYDAEILYDEFEKPDVINKWVKEKTYDMIPKLLDKMSSDFVLGMANAIAIDVDWAEQFDCYSTHKEKFNKIDKTTKNVSMMSNTYENSAKYFVKDNYKGVIIPYASYNKKGEVDYEKGNNLEFIGILPKDDVNKFINNLEDDFFDNFDEESKKATRSKQLKVLLPSFTYDYNLDNFKDVLKNLGIKKVFDEKKADLTNIISLDSRKKYGIDNIYVGEAIHKTHIELNEAGTKAAAVTYFGVLETTGFVEEEPKIIEMKFDKPFMYMIRDNKTKEVLFLGVVYEPNDYEKKECE